MSGGEMVIKALIAENVQTSLVIRLAMYPFMMRYLIIQIVCKHILVRHEQGAIHAAQGYARVSGKTGVVFATSGPGATNLITGLALDRFYSWYVYYRAGFAHLLGTDAFQETDVINITTPVTKWNCQVTEAAEIGPALAKAFYIAATGRPDRYCLTSPKCSTRKMPVQSLWKMQ